MEGAFVFLVNARYMLAYLHNHPREPEAVYTSIKVVAEFAHMAAQALLATNCAVLAPQTRCELLSVLARLLSALKPFELADKLCVHLSEMQAVVKSLSAPQAFSTHAYVYLRLSEIGEYAGRMAVGDATCGDALLNAVDSVRRELEYHPMRPILVITPMLKQTVLMLVENIKRDPNLPANVTKAVNGLKKQVHRRRIRYEYIAT
jgi:hypothetical protein